VYFSKHLPTFRSKARVPSTKKNAFSLPVPEDEGSLPVPNITKEDGTTPNEAVLSIVTAVKTSNLTAIFKKNLAMTQGFCNRNSCSNIMSLSLKPKA